MSLKYHTKGPAGQVEKRTQDFLNSLPKARGQNLNGIDPADIRRGPSTTIAWALNPEIVALEEIAIPVRDGSTRSARLYRTSEDAIAAPLLYFHGGCWVFCSLDTHDAICRYLCKHSGRTVISVDYRLAPEYKFPTGFNDCYDCSKWISDNFAKLKLSCNELVLSGDSAGGNLACVTALAAVRSKDFKVKGQVLFYPIADISAKTASYKSFSTGYFLTEELMDYGINHYIPNEQDRLNSLISPLLANDLQLLPKTLIQTAEFDVLRDEAEALAHAMGNAGVDVECVRYNGTIHAYLALAGKLPLGQQALDDSISFLQALN